MSPYIDQRAERVVLEEVITPTRLECQTIPTKNVADSKFSLTGKMRLVVKRRDKYLYESGKFHASISTNLPNRYWLSCGPGLASG